MPIQRLYPETHPIATPLLTAHDLRRRWKPHKEALLADRGNHPTCIRLHRAFSWIGRSESDTPTDLDLALICLWIAFNALYGQWNEQRREPQPDRESWRIFLDRLLPIDTSGHLSSVLLAERDLVMALFDDEYLSDFFWEDPGDIRAGKSKKSRYDARTWYIEKKWRMIFDRLLERIYMLRCQLVHGAATHGGKLNRHSLQQCVNLMRCMMNAILLVMIDHGDHLDWGIMCYPPLQPKS